MSDTEDTQQSGDDVASDDEYEIEPIDDTPEEELDEIAVEPVESGESDAWQEAAEEYELEDVDDGEEYDLEPVDDATPPEDDEEGLDEVAVEPVDDVADDDPAALEEVAVDAVDDFDDDDPATLDDVAVEPVDDAEEWAADDADDELEAAESDEVPPQDDDVDSGPPIEVQRSTERRTTEVQPLPEPGEYATAPTVTIYRDQSALDAVELDTERTVFGSRRFATSVDEPGTSPDVDDISDDDVEAIDDAAVEDALQLEPIEDEDVAPEATEGETTEDAPVDDDGAESKESAEALPADQSDYVELPDDLPIAAEHIAIYRQNKNYTLYALSDEPTQVNDRLVALGERVKLRDGDVIVVGEEVALGFDLDAA